MRVPVQDEVRPVPADRLRESLRAEHEPEPLRLAEEGVRRRRVVEEPDADAAAGDRAQTGVERLDVAGRLAVGLPEERLAEVRPAVAEAADEPLHADDPDRRAGERQDRVRAVEHDHARLAERLHDLGGAVGMPVVVAEDRDDRDGEVACRVGDDACLVELPVLRQVAGEEREVGALVELRERGRDPIGVVDAGVEVGGRGDADPSR